jgi:hypothetical protein
MRSILMLGKLRVDHRRAIGICFERDGFTQHMAVAWQSMVYGTSQ